MNRLKIYQWLYMAAVVFCVIGFLNFQSSRRTERYEKVAGYIANVEETNELTKAGYKTRYNYEIHWYRDGEEYERSVHKALTVPDESVTEFWVNEDNTDAIASEPSDIRKESYLNWLISFVCAVLASVIDWKTLKGKRAAKKNGKNSDAQILCSVVAFCMLAGVLITGFFAWISAKENYAVQPVMKDLTFIFLIGFIVSAIGTKKMK